MEMDYVETLKSWGLDAYIENFIAEGITDESFKLLKTDTDIVKALVPKLGPRLIFWKHFYGTENSYKEIPHESHGTNKDGDPSESNRLENVLVEEESTATTESVVSDELYSFVPDKELAECLGIYPETSTPNTSQNTPSHDAQKTNLKRQASDEYQPGPSGSKRIKSTVFSQDLSTVLNKYTEGKCLLLLKGKLSNSLRQKLVKIVLTELFGIYGLDIKSDIFIKAAEEIAAFFPNENASTYYQPYLKIDNDRKKSIGPRGKLYTKYINSKTQLRLAKAQVVKETTKGRTASANSPVKSPTEEISFAFLREAIEPQQKVLEAWEDCYNLRRKKYLNYSLAEIYEELPCLRQSFGITLIETDFNRKFPNCIDVIYTTWPKIGRAILEEAKDRKLQVAVCEDYTAGAVLILPYLINPITVKKSRKGCNWRPSRSEVQESFFVQLSTLGDIETLCLARKTKVENVGLTLQPFCAIIGNPENPSCYVLVIEDQKYLFDSCIRALELLFKFFHALDVEYPAESEHLWTFVSEAVFNIKPLYKSPNVTSLLSDLSFHLSGNSSSTIPKDISFEIVDEMNKTEN